MSKQRYPIFIPSKGRYNTIMTPLCLKNMGMDFFIVVEPQEYDLYAENFEQHGLDRNQIITLDMNYKKDYDYCDNEGTTKSTGSGPARNFIWQKSIEMGYDYHWIMDDNIKTFKILNNNEKIVCRNGKILTAMEDFVLRYKNVYMAGPHYTFFHPARISKPPFFLNSRIYSCNFIKNDIPFRWRGRYNEDTILSLDILHKGYCTILFNMFLQEKMTTMTVKGGNEDLYTQESYSKSMLEKSNMLVREYPQYAKLTRKYNRWHHHVNYKVFEKNKLVRKYAKDKTPKTVDFTLKRKIV